MDKQVGDSSIPIQEETKNYKLKIPKSILKYIIAFIVLLAIFVSIYNIGVKNSYDSGYKAGEIKSNNKEYANGYTSCYLNTLGNIEEPGWYIIKVGNTTNEKVDVITNSIFWNIFFKDKKPLQVIRTTKIGEENLYFINNDNVWFREK